MSHKLRLGSALSALAAASMLAGCAVPSFKGSRVNSKLSNAKVGLATRAHLALAAGDAAAAVQFAEQAVENSPNEPMLRTLLGNVYFAAGRFASAEAAYRDSLALAANQPQAVMKLALVSIAQGKNAEALAFLDAARGVVDPANYGLALALAGQHSEAVTVLDMAARAAGADARVRQNLALALGLAGDWGAARTVAAQDLSPDQVDTRVRQWMALAKPLRPSDQVAALIGVTPAAADPGQPLQLALKDRDERLAQVMPQAANRPAQAAPQLAYAEPALAASAMPPAIEAAPPVPPMPIEQVAESTADELAPVPVPSEAPAASFRPTAVAEAVAAPAAPQAAAAEAPLMTAIAPKIATPAKAKPIRRNGNSGIVVQLGAYSSPARVEAAWSQFASRHGALRQYIPSSARFQGPSGPVYRLSVKGFASSQEANGLCSSLRSKGNSCFVRRIAGDTPVKIASR